MSLFLCHHGIKGMKWGIRRTPEQLGHKNTRQAQSASETLPKMPRYAEFFSLYNKKRYWDIRNQKIEEHQKAIEQGAAAGKFSDKNGKINVLGMAMCGVTKNDEGKYVIGAPMNSVSDTMVRDAFYYYRLNREASTSNKALKRIYDSYEKKDLLSLLKTNYNRVQSLESNGFIFSDKFYEEREFGNRLEELRYFMRPGQTVQDFRVTEDMIYDAYNDEKKHVPLS